MKLKDLIEYCKLQGKCDNCEYIGACIVYFGGDAPSLELYDSLKWGNRIDWDSEIRKDVKE